MKPVLEQVSENVNSSFSIENISLPHFISTWHFHPVHEIVLFLGCTGTGFIGDAIYPFQPGTVSIIGKEMPHVWLNGKEYYQGNENFVAKAVVIKFSHDFLGKEFNQGPEMRPVKAFLQKASRGLVFQGKERLVLESKIQSIVSLDGLQRLACLFDILDTMVKSQDFVYLASAGYSIHFSSYTEDKITRVCKHIMLHFTRELPLEELAGVASMTPNAFCRFFKKSFLKTFKEFLNEVRVGNASKLLIEKNTPVSIAAYDSGFNNLTHFHRQFKRVVGMTPLEYQKKYSQPGFK
ncbi:MAG: AraC family transcriptional regulator [Bacteroidota bacterium]